MSPILPIPSKCCCGGRGIAACRQKGKPIHDAAENAERRLKLEAVNHQRPIWMLEKLVIVSHAFECACDYDGLKMLRAIEDIADSFEYFDNSLMAPEIR